MKFKLYFFLVSTLFLSACTSPQLTEKNKDIAVKEAQDYILDNVKNISLENRKIIQYTFPKIFKEEIFLTLGQEINQYYFAWDLEKPKVTVMVFGTGHKDFNDWEPTRLLFKEYNSKEYEDLNEITESSEVWSQKPTYQDTFYDTTRGNTQ